MSGVRKTWRPRTNSWSHRFVSRWLACTSSNSTSRPQNRCSYQLLAGWSSANCLWRYKIKGIWWPFWLMGLTGVLISTRAIKELGWEVGFIQGIVEWVFALLVVLFYYIFLRLGMRRFGGLLKRSDHRLKPSTKRITSNPRSINRSIKNDQSVESSRSVAAGLITLVLMVYGISLFFTNLMFEIHPLSHALIIAVYADLAFWTIFIVIVAITLTEQRAQSRFKRQYGYRADRALTPVPRLAIFLIESLVRGGFWGYDTAVAGWNDVCLPVDYGSD